MPAELVGGGHPSTHKVVTELRREGSPNKGRSVGEGAAEPDKDGAAPRSGARAGAPDRIAILLHGASQIGGLAVRSFSRRARLTDGVYPRSGVRAVTQVTLSTKGAAD